METDVLFIVGTGRSGSASMAKMLAQFDHAEVHHEYLCTHVQPLAVKYQYGLLSKEALKEHLTDIYGAALSYCPRPLFVDSSNKVSWIIEPLSELFPNAKFLHIYRDGRKVVSSYYNKLQDECYDDRSTLTLQRFLENPDQVIEPPPEKKYWWTIPRVNSPQYSAFLGYNQFERICYHWVQCIRRIQDDFSALDSGRCLAFKLESLVCSEDEQRELADFAGVPFDLDRFGVLNTPHNVSIPRNFLLTNEQQASFSHIAGQLMNELGYSDTPEYKIRYLNPAK